MDITGPVLSEKRFGEGSSFSGVGGLAMGAVKKLIYMYNGCICIIIL